MGNYLRGLVLDGQARVSVIDTSNLLKEIGDIHNLSTFARRALGRALCVGAYISFNIKNNSGKFNLILEGNSEIKKLYVSGEGQGHIKAYMDVEALQDKKDANISRTDFFSKDGYFTLIKDMGLKEPYIGRTEMISGNISDDFAYYLLKSEGVKSAVGLNVILNEDAFYSYGIICEAMPGASEEALYIVEDIMSQFNKITNFMIENDIKSTFDFFFGHLNSKIIAIDTVSFSCDCLTRVDDIIKSVGANEIDSLLKEREIVEIKCDYCNKKIQYDKEKLEIIFGRKF